MLRWVIIGLLVLTSALPAHARQQIRVVGSSTVYPFVTIAAEEFGRRAGFKTPIVESTGTGGGFKLFCAGVGDAYPDFANASRPIKSSEKEACAKQGVNDPVEIKLGYDGIVLANGIHAKRFNLSKTQIFKGLAKHVVVDGNLVANPYTRWSEISSELPDVPIKVYGPPPSSGTRDAFVELVMHDSCMNLPEFVKAYPTEQKRKQACSMLREDGGYVDAGENDNLIVQKLGIDPETLGIFGFSSLEENQNKVQGSLIAGVEPSFENITNASYSISRPLFIYLKREHLQSTAGLKEFLSFLMQDDMVGNEGVLALKGLIPLKADELAVVKETARSLD